MPDVGPVELFLVLIVVVLLFGGTRLAEIGGSLGKGVREFRKSISEDDEPEGQTGEAASTAASTAAGEPPSAVTAGACPRCGATNAAAARFCANCGAALNAPA